MILCVCPNPSIDTYAWLEQWDAGGVNRISKTKAFVGGKGIHVAMALHELGDKVRVMGFWAGSSGDWLKENLTAQNIGICGVDLPGKTRTCYTFRSSHSTTNHTELLEPGPVCDSNYWQHFLTLFKAEIQQVNLICISGSMPKGAPNDGYLQLLGEATKQGKKVFIDCSGLQLKHALTTSFFGLHLNAEEAKALDLDTSEYGILDNLKKSCSLIALTKGKEGLHLHNAHKSIWANVQIDNIKSTVGSGDCLTAGVLHALYLDKSLEETAKYGVACGAANCLNEDLGMLKSEDVNLLLPQVLLNTTHEKA